MKQVFIAWTPFIRRPESMRTYFGFTVSYLPPPFESIYLKVFGYLINSYRMFSLLVSNRPKVIWIQLAPVFLLYVAKFYKRFIRKDVCIIADCHNSHFYPCWMRFPYVIKMLNECDLVLIHNEKIKEKALSVGVSKEKIVIFETRPARIDCNNVMDKEGELLIPHPWILMPCSFDVDEPVKEVFDAARLMPDITLVITGNMSRAKGMHDLSRIPENVVLAGFLPEKKFNQYLCQADLLMGLTTQNDIQLSVANEAVGVGKAMVISDTILLRKLFNKGAVYVETRDPQSIATGCRKALEDIDLLVKDVQVLLSEKVTRWESQAEMVCARIENSCDADN